MSQDIMESWQWWLVAMIWFFAGWGWGQWWSERSARQERAALEHGRMSVSLPVNAEDAATTLEMLSLMVRKAEANRKAREEKR